MKTAAKLWAYLLALVILSPIGLVLPAKLKAGSAWGEWSAEEVQKLVGYVPVGMHRLAELWKAPLPDYSFRGQEDASLYVLSASYIASGILGIVVIVGITVLIGRALANHENTDAS